MNLSPLRFLSELWSLRELRAAAVAAHEPGEGNWHVGVIQRLVTNYPDCRYLEVGIRFADCWNRVAPLVGHAEGVDIDPQTLEHVKAEGRIHIMSSDDFFREYAGEPFDVIFLDGDHTFEQVSKDFSRAEPLLAPGGTIVLHDTWPMRPEETAPNACGTVYKLAAQLEADPAFNAFTMRRFPGVTLVQRAEIDRFGAP